MTWRIQYECQVLARCGSANHHNVHHGVRHLVQLLCMREQDKWKKKIINVNIILCEEAQIIRKHVSMVKRVNFVIN